MEAEVETAYDRPIVGFRNWALDSDTRMLASHGLRGIWTPGENVAVCKKLSIGSTLRRRLSRPSLEDYYYELGEFEPSHSSPVEGCTCGLYAWRKLIHLVSKDAPPGSIAYKFHGDYLPGVVKAWGRIIVHEFGFRAQYMQIVLLGTEDEHKGFLGNVEVLAQKYGVETVPLENMRRHAERFGVLL